MVRAARTDWLRHRFVVHDLHRSPGELSGVDDLALLDAGVQETGPDGARWAMATRGLELSPEQFARDCFLAWTLRGAPHAYRRGDRAAVTVATSPFSEADASKRIFDAASALKKAGLPVLDGLERITDELRDIVRTPMTKGEVSTEISARLGGPFVRNCVPCAAVHVYEQSFRYSVLQAGLELVPDTSPPVLRRFPRARPARYSHSGAEADARFDVVRNSLRFNGPERPADTAVFVDSLQRSVKDDWPDDAVDAEVTDVDDASGTALGELLPGPAERTVRLLGPYDPYLQLRNRALLVPDATRRKELWRTIGRPGAIVADGEVVATWRPRTSGERLTVRLDPWQRLSRADRAAIEVEAERLAAHRGVTLTAVVDDA